VEADEDTDLEVGGVTSTGSEANGAMKPRRKTRAAAVKQSALTAAAKVAAVKTAKKKKRKRKRKTSPPPAVRTSVIPTPLTKEVSSGDEEEEEDEAIYISSKAMYSYIPNPCGTPSVFHASFFQVVSPLVISFPSGSPQCGANKVKQINPRRYVMINRLQVISTSGNVTRTHLSYLLSFKLPPCMICSKLPCLTSL
jgi:hypothetical protein